MQHIANMLKIDGKVGETVRKNLLERTDLHTLLRLPTGIFYAQGVKVNVNVIFFDAKPASKTAWTKKLWIYDFRTNVHMTLKTKRLVKSDFDEFIACFKADDRCKPGVSERLHPSGIPGGGQPGRGLVGTATCRQDHTRLSRHP